MSKIRIDRRKLKGAINKAFDTTVEIVSDAFDDAITDERWNWPRQTQRVNGEIAGSPRSIVDTGELLESKVVTRSSVGNAVEYRWEAPHAAHVYLGATLKSGTELPARPWVAVGLEIAHPKNVFEEEFKKGLKRAN